jgi:hypothetical protein
LRDLSWWSGLFPFRRRSLAPAVSLTDATSGIRSLVGGGNQRLAPSPLSALPPEVSLVVVGGCTSIHFGENQLSPRSVGISPLPTAPPPVLQHGWVRASTTCHSRFTLAMGSSRGFGSHRRHLSVLRWSDARFRLGCPLAALLYRRLTSDADALAGSFYKRHAISPCSRVGRVASDCW